MKVSIIMGSKSDWPVMAHVAQILDKYNVTNEARVLSAHRTPEALTIYIKNAIESGAKVFIAGAGGAAHLPGVIAAQTYLPVVGVPIETKMMGGLDSLLSIVQMPSGVPVASMAVGKAGAINAALFAMSILGVVDPKYIQSVASFRASRAEAILAEVNPKELADVV